VLYHAELCPVLENRRYLRLLAAAVKRSMRLDTCVFHVSFHASIPAAFVMARHRRAAGGLPQAHNDVLFVVDRNGYVR
jgi:hypothetical protein